MISRSLACAALLLAVCAEAGLAKKPQRVPPQGKSIEVEVMRGGTVRIPLRGFERNLNRLVYRPLEKPRRGQLTHLEQYDGPERQGPGYITYTHGDDEDSTVDTFTFEVKAPLTKLTGRGRVTVRILDAPAVLLAPAALDFGKIAVGDPAARQVLELSNIGGGVIEGIVEPPEPFAVDGDGSFVLRRGETARIPLIFAPVKAGALSFRLQPSSGDPAVVTLRGEALAPFEVAPDQGSFLPQADGSRVATAEVTNISRRPLRISLALPPDSAVEPVPDLELAPGESAKVALRIPPETKTFLPEFDIRFEGADHAETRKFSAPALPAKLVVVSSPDFVEVSKQRDTLQATLVLRNAGGAVAEGKLLPHASIFPADGTTAFSIAAGAEYSVDLELQLKKDQPIPADMTVAFQGRELSIPVRIATASPTPTPTPTPTPAPPPPAWTLNQDIKLEESTEGPCIVWEEKSGWKNYTLQHRPAGAEDWRDYQPPPPPGGMIGWVQGLLRRARNFLSTPIKRTEVDGLSEEEKFGRLSIDAGSVGNADLWRLQAVPTGEATARSISTIFRITASELVAELPPPDPPAPSPATALSPATGAARPHAALGPTTKIEHPGYTADRRSALLQIAFARELDLRGFRLEQMMENISDNDPKTGIPQGWVFEKLDPPGAKIEILGMVEGEAGGRKLTLCLARIDGLTPGTRTYWRVVAAGPQGELPPTTEFLVVTLPQPPFPWNKVFLFALLAFLAVVLYLRWRLNRLPR